MSFVVWFTGLPSAGKTTLAEDLAHDLKNRGLAPLLLDGDKVRRSFCADLGFTEDDRAENVRRVASAAALACDQEIITIVSLISPYHNERIRAIHAIGVERCGLVWVDTKLDICEFRDSKGLYMRARRNEIKNMTGVNDPYEPPENAIMITGVGDRRKNIIKLNEALSKKFAIYSDRVGTGTVAA